MQGLRHIRAYCLALLLLPATATAQPEDIYTQAGIPPWPRLYSFDAYETAFRVLRDGTVPLPTFEDPVGQRVLDTVTHVKALFIFRDDAKPYHRQVPGIIRLREDVDAIRQQYQAKAAANPAYTDEAAHFAAFQIYVAEKLWRAYRNVDVEGSEESFTSISGIESGELYTSLATAIGRGVDDALSPQFADEANRLRLLTALDETLFRLREALALQQKLQLADRLETSLLGQSEAIDARVQSIVKELRLTEAEQADLYQELSLDEVLAHELRGEKLDHRVIVGAIRQHNPTYEDWKDVARETNDPQEEAWVRARMYMSQVKWALIYHERHGGWPFRSWLVADHHEKIAPVLLKRYRADPTPINAFFAFYPTLCLKAEPDLQNEDLLVLEDGPPETHLRNIMRDEDSLALLLELHAAAAENARIASFLKNTLRHSARRLYFSRRDFLLEQQEQTP